MEMAEIQRSKDQREARKKMKQKFRENAQNLGVTLLTLGE